jgi:spore germination cell wall hydrolase CwlJ-like protein
MAAHQKAARFSCALIMTCLGLNLSHAKETQPPQEELQCLAVAIYFEARGEPEKGQLAVGRVIVNRAQSGDYPDTVCGVVYQGAERKNACQFSFACDGIPDVVKDKRLFAEIKTRAVAILACNLACGEVLERRGSLWASTHYHASFVNPYWAKDLKRTGRVGQHIFYCPRNLEPQPLLMLAHA